MRTEAQILSRSCSVFAASIIELLMGGMQTITARARTISSEGSRFQRRWRLTITDP